MVDVAVVGPVFPDSFADNILDSLRRMGIHCVGLGSGVRRHSSPLIAAACDVVQRVEVLEKAAESKVRRQVAKIQVDVAIVVEGDISPGLIDFISKSARRVVLWFPDAVANLGRQRMFSARYDRLFFKDPLLVQRASLSLGAPAHYLPEGCNPSWHRPGLFPKGKDVVVAGNLYPTRVRLLERLATFQIPLAIYGPRWPQSLSSSPLKAYWKGEYIARHRKAEVFRSGAAVLNSLHPGEMAGANCRLFEGAGCGGAVVTERRTGLDDLFTPERDVLAFTTFEELLVKLRRLVDDPASGTTLGDRAASVALSEHTYDLRLARLLDVALS